MLICESSRVTLVFPHCGHGGVGLSVVERNSSKRSWHPHSGTRRSACRPSLVRIERLREEAAAQGVSPTDEDLEAVLDFVTRILPALDEIERRLPPETQA